MSPGVNDGEVLQQTLADLYAFGRQVHNVSVVPVGLTEYSKHQLVREPTAVECQRAVDQVESWARRSRAERGRSWAFGADELYLRAGRELPGPEAYDGFDQVENGVGSVRYLQERIRESAESLGEWSGRRIAVLTGTSMAALMPQVLEPLAAAMGAVFELIPLTNTLFGSSVTCAGLLPGSAFRRALADRRDLDLALIPAEAINDDGLFMDNLTLESLRSTTPVDVRPSYYFTDSLDPPVAA